MNLASVLLHAVSCGDGRAIAEAVRIRGRPTPSSPPPEISPSQCGGNSFVEAIAPPHAVCVACVMRGEFAAAYDALAGSFDAFLTFYAEQSDGWLNPALRVMITDLRLIAIAADKLIPSESPNQNQRTKKTVNFLERSFRAVMSKGPITPTSKKFGALHVVNSLFKLHFKLNTVRMCNTFVRSVNSPLFPPLDSFPLADRAAYNFYLGKLALMEDKLEDADAALCKAMRICRPDMRKNRNLVMQYLVPVKMCRGFMPSASELRENNLNRMYDGIVAAVKRGDLELFHKSLAANEAYFIQMGLFLLMQKLESYALRSLVRNSYLSAGDNKVNLGRLIRAPSFVSAIRASASGGACLHDGSDESDVYAVLECILANLIYSGLVKGYVAHERRYLVLSSKDAFPSPAN